MQLICEAYDNAADLLALEDERDYLQAKLAAVGGSDNELHKELENVCGEIQDHVSIEVGMHGFLRGKTFYPTKIHCLTVMNAVGQLTPAEAQRLHAEFLHFLEFHGVPRIVDSDDQEEITSEVTHDGSSNDRDAIP